MGPINLPIADSHPRATPEVLLRQTIHAYITFDATLGETLEVDCGTVVRARELPLVYSANCVLGATLPATADATAAVAQTEELFARQGLRCWKWLIAPENANPGLIPALEARGYLLQRLALWVLGRAAAIPVQPDLTVIPARASFAQLRAIEMADASLPESFRTQMAEAAVRRLDEPAIDGLIALRDGRGIGNVEIVGSGELGYIAGLGVLPEARGQGVGTTLLGRALELAARSRFRYVTVFSDYGCPITRGFYERAGFVQIGEAQVYVIPQTFEGSAA